jgi:predicted TIM-barrel enzyme
MWFQNSQGDAHSMFTFTVSLTPASVSANVAAEQAFTVTNGSSSSTLRKGITPRDTDLVMVTGPGTGNSSALVGSRINSTGQLVLVFENTTAGGLTPAAGTYRVFLVRP